MMGETPDHGLGRDRGPDTGHGQDGADADHGLDGGNSTTSAADGVEHAGRRAGPLRAGGHDLRRGGRGVHAHPPLLEVHHPRPAPASTTCVSTGSSDIGSSRTPAASGGRAPR
jgi:hypothetical protein